jgi:hypothetical protein
LQSEQRKSGCVIEGSYIPGKLDLYNLGQLGVNTDKNPIELEDGELTKSQNAIHDPLGSMGGLRKRPGLVKVNSVAAAGSINGAVGVPIVVGSAGNDGGLTPAPAVAPDTRTFLVARRITSSTAGWNTSTDGFVTSPTTGGPDGFAAAATPRVPDNLWVGMEESGDSTLHKCRAIYSGRPMVTYRNRLYYAGNDYTFQSTSPTIRMWDGTTDYKLTVVPARQNTVAEAVTDMIVGGDGLLYFIVHDSGVNSANTMKSRVFSLDPNTGVLSQVGSGFPLSPETVRVPFSLCWHQGQLWTRTHGAGIGAASQVVYNIRPGIDSEWTIDTSDGTTHTSCNLLMSFQGQLFMPIVADQNTAALIRLRSTLGVFSTTLTATLVQSGAPTMTAFGYANAFTCGAIFGGNLYLAYWNQEGAANDNSGDKYLRIYKYTGSAWSCVYAPAANDADNIPYNQAVVIGGTLYFVSAPERTSSNTQNRILRTSDGSNFTSVTTSILDDVSGGVMGALAS